MTGETVKKTGVVYVMGAGHSGSTILGVTLGNCTGFFYAGELEWWLRMSGAPNFGGVERTRFWASVRGRVPAATDLFGIEVRDAIERSGSRLRFWTVPVRRRLRPRYRRVTDELFRAVASASGAERVIDTSHFPMRARELQRSRELDLHLIYLVRDPRGVVASELAGLGRHSAAERARRLIAKNLDLWLTSALSVMVFLRQPRARRMLVRHEQFLAEPERVLRETLDHMGASSPLPDLDSLETGMPLRGNRLLGEQTIALERDPSPPERPSRVTALLQLPFSMLLARLRPVSSGATGSVRGRAPKR